VARVLLFVYAMTMRIDVETEGDDDNVVLHVAGRLAGDAIAQLTDACKLESGYVLDLSKLRFADDAGVQEIQRLSEGGANIRGASSFIKLLIGDETK
jgi:hypothetical protein